MAEEAHILKRLQVLADFGDFTLKSDNLDEILTEACRLVGDALGTGRAKVLEIEKETKSLLLRAGVGWAPGIVGHLRLPMAEHSSETFAIEAAEPVVSQDINKEDRFEFADFLKEAGRPTACCRWMPRNRAHSARRTHSSCAPTPPSWGR
jgi:GAF domain-containing protein